MRKIKKFVDAISEELEDAKEYAESYVEAKAKGETGIANRCKEMAGDEIKHAMYLHEMVVAEIKEISKVYTPPADMQEKWDMAHKEYVEKAAWIKQMLAM
jgi:imidazolonepropionase-like amidohydrolase